MYQEERLKKIVEWLEIESTLSNQELMERLSISRDTARRDIVKLTKLGKAIRTHGGIARTDYDLAVPNYEGRMELNPEAKKRIAEKAVEKMKEPGVYFLDVSTHMKYLCPSLKPGLEIYTHSLDNLGYLSKIEGVDVHCFGGKLNKENHFFYGHDVLERLRRIRFQGALLGAAALDLDGIYYENTEDAAIKRLVVQRAKEVIVMADASKFQKTSKFHGASWKDVDLLITDAPLTKEWEELFRKERVVCIVV